MEVKDLLRRMGENLSVHRAFGTAYESNGTLVIPVAMVAGGGGGGEGEGVPSDAEVNEVDDQSTPAVPHGSGGGFGGVVLPVGAYVVKDDDVRWVPAVNVTLIAILALGVARLLIRTTSRVLRS